MEELMEMPSVALDDANDEGGQTTEISWIAPAVMTYDQWSGIGSTFQQISRSINWWLGDWLNAGEMRWGEMAMQAVEETGRGVDSLKKCKAVATRFPPENRVEALSWSHHRAICYLEQNERDEWLGAALSYDISTRDLNVIARFDRFQRQKLLEASRGGASQAEFTRIFDLVRLDRESDTHTTITTQRKGSLRDGESYAGEYDEEEDGLPFGGQLADDSDWEQDQLKLDIEEVFSFFEAHSNPLKVVRVAEAIWEGMSVRADLDNEGYAILVWEQVP